MVGAQKECRTCGEFLPETDEYFASRSDTGRPRSECNGCRKLYLKSWRERNPAYPKLRYEAHKEHILEQNRSRRQDNLEEARSWDRGRYQKDNEKRLLASAIQRGKRRGSGGSFSAEDVRRQLQTQAGLCYWCAGKMDEYEHDHFIPLSRGGTNFPENIVLAHRACNRTKSSLPPEVFFARLSSKHDSKKSSMAYLN